jgi:hypothetical protein
VRVHRRVSSRGGIQVVGQRVQVGFRHAGATVIASGSVGLANAWIAIASFALSVGWVILSTRVLERWTGWWLVVAGLGLVFSRFVWTTDLWTLPYLLFWLWVVILSIRLLRRPSLLDPAQQ